MAKVSDTQIQVVLWIVIIVVAWFLIKDGALALGTLFGNIGSFFKNGWTTIFGNHAATHCSPNASGAPSLSTNSGFNKDGTSSSQGGFTGGGLSGGGGGAFGSCQCNLPGTASIVPTAGNLTLNCSSTL